MKLKLLDWGSRRVAVVVGRNRVVLGGSFRVAPVHGKVWYGRTWHPIREGINSAGFRLVLVVR